MNYKNSDFKSILLFKLRYIGDVLLTTPAIRLLRQACPAARITMVVNKGTEDVLRYNPHVDNVITIERRRIEAATFFKKLKYEWGLLKTLREWRYDLTVDFDSGERAAFLAFLCNARTRIGFHYPKGLRRFIFNRRVKVNGRLHIVERNLLLVEKTLNLVRDDSRMELYTGQEEELRSAQWLIRNGLSDKDLVVIHPGGRFQSKRWAVEKWARLADLIQGDSGVPVVITGGESEREDVSTITYKMKTAVHSLVEQTTVLELAALLKRATLFIGNDSGPTHIAAAAGSPVIALFGPTDPSVWGPWGKGHVVISKHAACSPCKVLNCTMDEENCMEQISVEEVFHSVSQSLKNRAKNFNG